MSSLRMLAAQVMLGQEVFDAWKAWQRGDTTEAQLLEELNQSVLVYIDSTKEQPNGNQGSVG